MNMKQLNLYKIVGKDNKEVLCVSVKNLLAHLRELDVLAVRDDKAVLSTLFGELAESIGELSLPEPITAENRVEKELPEPKPMGKRAGSVGKPSIEEEDDEGLLEVPRPVQKRKPLHSVRADDEVDEPEEAEVGEGDEEEFSLR
jgi:hypothetical protein